MEELTREKAWELLCEYTKTPALRQHALQVEAVMQYFAKLANADEKEWGIAGLLHDFDYEKFPDEHCYKGAEIMRERGIDEKYIHALFAHAYGICTDVKPESQMEMVLYTVDELTGLINAVCKMRPSQSVLDLKVKSVKKKFKESCFASGVNRKTILNGCEMLGLTPEDVIQKSIDGLKEKSQEVGLKGILSLK